MEAHASSPRAILNHELLKGYRKFLVRNRLRVCRMESPEDLAMCAGLKHDVPASLCIQVRIAAASLTSWGVVWHCTDSQRACC